MVIVMDATLGKQSVFREHLSLQGFASRCIDRLAGASHSPDAFHGRPLAIIKADIMPIFQNPLEGVSSLESTTKFALWRQAKRWKSVRYAALSV